MARAERASGLLFGEPVEELGVEDVLAVFGDVPSTEVGADRLGGAGMPMAEILLTAGLVTSKGEAARLIRAGGIYVNNRRVTDERARLLVRDAIAGELFVIRKGARQQHLVRLKR